MGKVQSVSSIPKFADGETGGGGAILLCICHDPEVDDVWSIMNQKYWKVSSISK